MSDPIPLDVLATWLAPEALARIDHETDQEQQAAQCDAELAVVGLEAVWQHGVEGPALLEIRVLDPRIDAAAPEAR